MMFDIGEKISLIHGTFDVQHVVEAAILNLTVPRSVGSVLPCYDSTGTKALRV